MIISDSVDEIVNNNYLKIVIIKSGSGIIKINGIDTVFTSPELFCFNDDDKITIIKSKDLDVSSLLFDPSIINENLTLDNIKQGLHETTAITMLDGDSLRPFIIRDDAYCGMLSPGPAGLTRLMQLSDATLKYVDNVNESFRPCRIRSYFLEMIFFIVEMYYRRDPIKIDVEMINYDNNIYDVILHLASNYHTKITIDDLVKIFNTNRNTLREKFIKVTGVPVITYLIKLRVRIASILLKDTTLNVSEIMEHVGFEDISHFGRIFRKYVGVSPSAYRKG